MERYGTPRYTVGRNGSGYQHHQEDRTDRCELPREKAGSGAMRPHKKGPPPELGLLVYMNNEAIPRNQPSAVIVLENQCGFCFSSACPYHMTLFGSEQLVTAAD